MIAPESATLAAPGSVESLTQAMPAGTHAGARFRGTANPDPIASSEPTLNYYCTLPLARRPEAIATVEDLGARAVDAV